MPTNKLPPGSLVLITGANGFLGSHICDQLLLAGYRVRGTVRDTEKQAWLVEYFDKKHGKGKFELAHVPDFTADGCLDEAIKGCAAIAHTASDLSFSPDPNEIITPVIKATQRALEAAMKEPGIKSFVLTSSSTAATKANPDKKFHIDRNTWNEEEVKTAWAPPPYTRDRVWAVYGASKTQGEQAAWQFVKENKPSFTVNTVLPNANFGAILDAERQEGSTAGWIRAILKGDKGALTKSIAPQYYVDPVDTALLHVAALTDLSLNGERIFAFAEPFHWAQVIEILRKLRPDADLPKDFKDNGQRDLSTVDNELAVKILKGSGRDGFKGLEQSLKELVDSLP